MSDQKKFSEGVIEAIRQIPKGKVATYGQIAALAGKPHGSRGVAWILHSSSAAKKLPWQRIINSQGKISFPEGTSNHRLQKRLLEKEGVVFSSTGRVAMSKFQWKKMAKPKRSRGNAPRLFSGKN